MLWTVLRVKVSKGRRRSQTVGQASVTLKTVGNSRRWHVPHGLCPRKVSKYKSSTPKSPLFLVRTDEWYHLSFCVISQRLGQFHLIARKYKNEDYRKFLQHLYDYLEVLAPILAPLLLPFLPLSTSLATLYLAPLFLTPSPSVPIPTDVSTPTSVPWPSFLRCEG